MGAANAVIPIARVAQNAGDIVTFISEGLATERVRAAGFEPVFTGSINFEKEPFEFDAEKALTQIEPHFVVVGQSAPINLEERIALAANLRNIPVVSVTDFWGGSVRSSAKLTSIVCLDEFDRELAIRAHPKVHHTLVGGNPGVPTPEERERIIGVSKTLDYLHCRYSGIIVYVGGAPERTTGDLGLVIDSLRMTPGMVGLIFRPHPKHVNRTDNAGRRYGDIWNEILYPRLGDKYLGEFSNLSADAVVASADVVISDFSTMLTTAASLGKRTVSLVTPNSMQALTKLSNSPVIPQVHLGLSFAISKPTDLREVLYPQEEALARLKPVDSLFTFNILSRWFAHR